MEPFDINQLLSSVNPQDQNLDDILAKAKQMSPDMTQSNVPLIESQASQHSITGDPHEVVGQDSFSLTPPVPNGASPTSGGMASRNPASAPVEDDSETPNIAPKKLLASNTPPSISPPSSAPTTAPSQPFDPLAGDVYGKELNDAALKSAQGKQDNRMFINNMGKSLAQTLSSLAGNSNPNLDYFDDLNKQSGMDAQHIKDRRAGIDENLSAQKKVYDLASEKERNDPNSKVSLMTSQLVHTMAAKAGISLDTTGMSTASIEKIYGPMERYFGMVESAKNRAAMSADKKSDKDQERIAKYTTVMGKDLDPNQARSGALGKSQMVINDTQSLEALAHNYGDLNKVPTAQYAEMAGALDRLISRGNPSVERFKHLMPGNLSLSGAGMMQWIQSKPVGAQQGEFIKTILATAARERDVAQQQIRDAQITKALSTHGAFKSQHPDEWENTLAQSLGVSKDEARDMVANRGKKSEPHSSDSDMIKVVSPEGQVGMMPKANLEKAKARGFKEVQ